MPHAEKCPVCKGVGKIAQTFLPGEGSTSSAPYWQTCHGCEGKGWMTAQDKPKSQTEAPITGTTFENCTWQEDPPKGCGFVPFGGRTWYQPEPAHGQIRKCGKIRILVVKQIDMGGFQLVGLDYPISYYEHVTWAKHTLEHKFRSENWKFVGMI